jgi:4'-phosphopantetheinyl transferase
MFNRKQVPNIFIQPDDIHLWIAFPNEIFEKYLLSAYWELLTREEQQRQQSFYFEKDRHLYLVSHALVRTILSNYTGIDPKKINLIKNNFGRPELDSRDSSFPLRFNLSHTDGLIACAVILKGEIGVDVEKIKYGEKYMELANSYFSDQEKYDLDMTPMDEKKNRFVEYWTLKESYTKAKGMGLYIPLEKISFNISESEPINVTFDPELNDNPRHWQFYLYKPATDYRVALSVLKPTNAQMKIRKIVPLAKVETLDCDLINKSILKKEENYECL